MDNLREAVAAAHDLEQRHPGLTYSIVADVLGIKISATYAPTERSVMRLVSWAEINHANINTLTATVGLVANKLTAKAPASGCAG